MTNFQFSIFNFQGRRGFTLIETLVAITILVFAVATPLTLAAQSLFAAYYAKDQLIASHLAQEAIEVVRQKRDYNLMYILKNPNENYSWLNGILDSGEESAKVTLDVRDITNLDFEDCASIDNFCAILKFNGAIYQHANGDDTRFRRVVDIGKISDNEIEIIAKVKWQTGAFRAREFTIKENLYNWLPN